MILPEDFQLDSWKYSRTWDNWVIALNPCITSRLQDFNYSLTSLVLQNDWT